MKAAPAAAIGYFSERAVSPALRDSFACVWVHQMPEAGVPPVIVTPDGTIDLQWIDGIFRIAGPDKDPKIEMIAAGSAVIGFRFHPSAAAAWLKTSATEILGQRVWLDDLWGAKARHLANSIRDEASITDLLISLESILARCLPERPPVDKAMAAAFTLIEQGPPPGAPLVPWLGRALAMSERTLRRRFGENFGYGPKTLDRILRYRRFQKLRRCCAAASTAALAAEAGYSDQAHLVRESRRLTGITPLAFERSMGAAMGSSVMCAAEEEDRDLRRDAQARRGDLSAEEEVRLSAHINSRQALSECDCRAARSVSIRPFSAPP
jgi:AraC-like DNA-binding protein